jgi:hypothetical protein
VENFPSTEERNIVHLVATEKVGDGIDKLIELKLKLN